MMPDDRRYTKNHEWVKKLSDDEFLIGVTPRILRTLGNLIYVDLPDVSDEVMIRLPFGEIESEERLHELNPPMDGAVVDVNEAVLDELDMLSADPLEKGWLIRIKTHTPEQFEALMEASAYNEMLN